MTKKQLEKALSQIAQRRLAQRRLARRRLAQKHRGIQRGYSHRISHRGNVWESIETI